MTDPTSDSAAPIRVLVADDQKVVRDGLVLILGLLEGIEVVGSAIDGADAVRQVASTDPDVVLMDLNMPTLDGVEATRAITDRGLRARVVVLTTYADDDWVFRALQAGARGFLTKGSSAQEIHQAITTVAHGQAQLDPSVQRRLLDALVSGATWGTPDESPEPADPQDGLTPREVDVLTEIAEGLSNTEIAARLVLSQATVKTHVNHLLAKTCCRDRAALVVYAYRTGRAAIS
jgi:DNA-binding NarL/FixJ family response regulator